MLIIHAVNQYAYQYAFLNILDITTPVFLVCFFYFHHKKSHRPQTYVLTVLVAILAVLGSLTIHCFIKGN